MANDDHFQLMSVGLCLKSAKVNIKVEGVNGLEVYQYIQMNPNVKLDFILLDLNMPIMDGFEACRQITNLYKSFNMFKLERKPQIIEKLGFRSNKEVD